MKTSMSSYDHIILCLFERDFTSSLYKARSLIITIVTMIHYSQIVLLPIVLLRIRPHRMCYRSNYTSFFIFRTMSFTPDVINVLPIISPISSVRLCCWCLITPAHHLIVAPPVRAQRISRLHSLYRAVEDLPSNNARESRAPVVMKNLPQSRNFLGMPVSGE